MSGEEEEEEVTEGKTHLVEQLRVLVQGVGGELLEAALGLLVQVVHLALEPLDGEGLLLLLVKDGVDVVLKALVFSLVLADVPGKGEVGELVGVVVVVAGRVAGRASRSIAAAAAPLSTYDSKSAGSVPRRDLSMARL